MKDAHIAEQLSLISSGASTAETSQNSTSTGKKKFVSESEAKEVARWMAKEANQTVYLFKYTDDHYEAAVFQWYFDIPFMKFRADGTEEVTHLYREGEKDEKAK